MEPEIGNWTLRDLTIVDNDFYPMFCDLADTSLKEYKTPYVAIDALTRATKNVIDHVLFGDKLIPIVDDFDNWKNNFSLVLRGLTTSLLVDDDIRAEGLAEVNKEYKVRQILHLVLERMIADLVNNAWIPDPTA